MKKSWFIVLMLFIAGAISYMDRAALSIAAPLITKELNLDPAQLGIVFSAFFVGYSVFCFIGGYASDRFGAKRVLVTSMGLWSIFCGLTAGVFSMGSLLIVRVIFGAGEGPYATCTNKILNGWFEHNRQTTAVGFANAGQQFGGAIAGPIVGILALHFGWRVSFIAIALMGLVWVAIWAATVTDRPGEHDVESRIPEIAARHAALDGGAGNATEPVTPLMTYLRNPQILATSFAFFGYAYILYFFLSWFPSYLTMERHLSIASMSFVSVIPWTFGVIGVALGGWVSDLLFRATGNALLARKLVIVVSLIVAAVCVAIAGNSSSVSIAVAMMAITVFFMNMTLGVYWGIILDIVEPARMGGVGGFMHFVANTAGILAPAITGFLVQWTKLFQSAFVLSGCVALAGALAVAFFVRSKPQAQDVAEVRSLPV